MRCSTGLAISRVHLRSTSSICLTRRAFSDSRQQPPTRYESDPETSPESVQNVFIERTSFAFRNLGKVFAYIGYGTVIIGLVTATAFEGGHYWIERKMRHGSDEDAKRWGWEADGWTGGDEGGTSRALGFYGRHAVRAAWFTLHHSSPFGDATISRASGGQGAGNLNVVSSDIESARSYLEAGLACVRDSEGRVPMNSVGVDLLERHAAVLERIGTREDLARAREEYIQIMDGRAGQRLAQARIAVKLGNISECLGNDEEALSWWSKGIDLTADDAAPDAPAPTRVTRPEDGVSNSSIGMKAVLTRVFRAESPSVPAAQRTLVAALLSVSAYYSKRNQLEEAKRVQDYTISLIDAMTPTPVSQATGVSQSPGQILHHMYLLQRQSVLRVHRAEVTFTMASARKDTAATLPDLLTAASSSEVIVQALTGTSQLSIQPSAKSDTATVRRAPQHSPVPNAALSRPYRESPWLRGSAESVLRGARLTAVEAWDLCGVLYGQVEGEDANALKCFERAWEWVGVPGAGSDSGEGMGVRVWRPLWERLVEAQGRAVNQGPNRRQDKDASS